MIEAKEPALPVPNSAFINTINARPFVLPCIIFAGVCFKVLPASLLKRSGTKTRNSINATIAIITMENIVIV
jgi:hypothetical protein